MTVKEMMQKLIDEDANDIDFCDDYDESAMCAYCLNHWSPEAEEKYAKAFALTVDEKYSRLKGDDRIVIVHCEDDPEVDALHDLLYAMAGYIGEEEYDRLFPEPEEVPPEYNTFDVVLSGGKVIKAIRIDFTPTMNCGVVVEIQGEDKEWDVMPMSQIVRIIGEVK